jgi:membrane associated rhomboid family serine protease
VSVERLPWLTIAFVIISATFSCYLWYFAPRSFVIWLFYDPTGRFVLALIHPIVHINWTHLAGNMIFGIGILGTLIESWMTLLTRKFRYGIFAFCYLASLAVSVLVWKSPIVGPVPAVGSSGLVFASLPFPLFYCGKYYDRIQFRGRNLLAPVGIVIVSVFLIAPVVFATHLAGYTILGMSPALHLMSFLISFVFAIFLFDRIKTETQQLER